jgi:hypothetical protein
MRPMFAVTAGVTLLLLASTGWAGGQRRVRLAQNTGDASKVKETPPAFNKTFQWEEKELGPKDKGVDHKKIQALQEQGRRDDEARRKEQAAGGQAKKPARADGITGPATATLPTMDIEKPAPAGSIKTPVRKASYTPPKTHDEIDNVLAENGVGDSASSDALGSVLGRPSKAHPAKHAKRATRHAKRRR